MRRQLRDARRLISAAVAIVLGVAFVAASLALGGALDQTLKDSVAGTVGDAAVVVSPGLNHDSITTEVIAAVGRVQGVTNVKTLASAYLDQNLDGRLTTLPVSNVPELSERTKLVAGRLPTASGDIAINQVAADERHLAVGDTLTLAGIVGGPAKATVVGIVVAGVDVTFTPTSLLAFGIDSDLVAWGGSYDAIHAFGSGDPGWLASAIGRDPVVSAANLTVRTGTAEVASQVAALSTGTAMLVGVLLAFAAIAMLVAGLVIANTFSILVAQRTRQLALRRCVGSSRAQIFMGVVTEALALAVVAGVIGLGLGLGLAKLVVRFSQNSQLNLTRLSVTPTSLLIPLAVAVVVTLIASLVPARQATRIAPLAALRAGATASGSRPGPVRLVAGLATFAVGTAALLAGAVGHLPAGTTSRISHSFIVGMLGGAVSFVGTLVLAPFIVPGIARLLVRPSAAVAGITGQLAAENAVRNPKRAAATAGALLVGVSLITMVGVAADSGSASISARLGAMFPVDAQVLSATGTLNSSVVDAVRAVSGVSMAVTVKDGSSVAATAGNSSVGPVVALAASDASVTRDPHLLDGLIDDTIIVSPEARISTGTTVTLTDGERSMSLRAMVAKQNSSPTLVTPATLAKVAPEAGNQVWVRFADAADATKTSEAVGAAAAKASPGVLVTGAALMRQTINGIVDTMLAIVVGLLAISVVIALVGVGNTLGLSVLERTQESGLLRAMGLSRAQLGRMVGLEAVLVSGVAVVLGLALGIGYGIAGTHALLGANMPVVLSIPVARLGIAAAVALLAGLLASILPALRASRVSPAAALAQE